MCSYEYSRERNRMNKKIEIFCRLREVSQQQKRPRGEKGTLNFNRFP